LIATCSQKKLIIGSWLELLFAFVNYSTDVVGRVVFFENFNFIEVRHSGIIFCSNLFILVLLLLIVSLIIEHLDVISFEELLQILDVLENKSFLVDLIVIQKTFAIVLQIHIVSVFKIYNKLPQNL